MSKFMAVVISNFGKRSGFNGVGWRKPFLILALSLAMAGIAGAATFTATNSLGGDWATTGTWDSPNGPVAGDNANIGNAAGAQLVSLSANQAAQDIGLGWGDGALDLATFTLTANFLNVGASGVGTLTRSAGSTLTLNRLDVRSGSSVSTLSGDSIAQNMFAASGFCVGSPYRLWC